MRVHDPTHRDKAAMNGAEWSVLVSMSNFGGGLRKNGSGFVLGIE
jgi:hypothetical protein